jgi:transposase-like protein
MQCQRCQSERFSKEGHDWQGRHVYRCQGCKGRRTEHSTSAFAGYRFPPDIIALAVAWYLRYRLSYADLAELLAERGIHVDPSTLYDWVQHFTPLYQEAARAHRRDASSLSAQAGKWEPKWGIGPQIGLGPRSPVPYAAPNQARSGELLFVDPFVR